jgi:hypothetical protein
MTNDEKLKIEEKVCKYLFKLEHSELRALKINGQQAVKIKNGVTVRFYIKALRRLLCEKVTGENKGLYLALRKAVGEKACLLMA